MAVRAATAPKDGRRPRPLFTVFCDYETVTGRLLELFNGAVVTPGQVAPYMTEADMERAVFDGKSRIVDLGRRRRFFTDGARRAVELRDQHCQGFACDTTAERCEVDHIQPWENGGPTDQDNGELRCPFHHRHRHKQDRSPPPDDGEDYDDE
jgi:hypothetical protein